jgi:hypothetical protein
LNSIGRYFFPWVIHRTWSRTRSVALWTVKRTSWRMQKNSNKCLHAISDSQRSKIKQVTLSILPILCILITYPSSKSTSTDSKSSTCYPVPDASESQLMSTGHASMFNYSGFLLQFGLVYNGVFGLMNDVVHLLLTHHFFYLLVCGMEWVDPSQPHFP